MVERGSGGVGNGAGPGGCMDACEWRETCGFFKKFGNRRSRVWTGLVDYYCTGGAAPLCERRKGYLSGETPEDDDLMPTGSVVPDPFQALD